MTGVRLTNERLAELIPHIESALEDGYPLQLKGDDLRFLLEAIKARLSAEPSAPRELTLQDFGYAPGNYAIKCLDCGQEALWCDKRAARCETCAKQALAENRKGLSQRTNHV